MDDHTVALRLVQLTTERLVELGCDPAELARRAPVPRGAPWRHVPFARLCELVEAGLLLTDVPNLGLHLRLGFDARQGGVLLLVMLACPDLGAALQRAERYQRIVSDAHRITVEEGGRRLVGSVPGPERPAVRHVREWMLADVHASISVLTGEPAVPLEVTFQHAEPEQADELERFFGCPVHFGASRTTILWPDDVVGRRLRHANALFLAALEEQVRELVVALPRRVTWAQRTRAALVDTLPEEVSVERVAARLRVSRRTFQRRLRDEGSSLAEVLVDVRRELAARYLEEGRDVAEVSYLLGYATPTSFHRAFRTWYQTTPSAFRERALRR